MFVNLLSAAMLAVNGVNAPIPAEQGVLFAADANAVPGSYIVVTHDSASIDADAAPAKLAARYGGRVGHVYDAALKGFSVRLSAQQARRLAADPAVAYVEADRYVSVTGTQNNPPSWGLNRIDQRNLPMDSSYTYPTTAAGVRAYIIDTGIRFSHNDFGGRAVSGFDAVDGGSADDCNGHGTHVAGTVGGGAYGVAKGVTLVGVRVLNCLGQGTSSWIIAGINWVTGDHDPGERAVANMSLGGPADPAMDTAVQNSIADGVVYSVSAGNDNGGNACNKSPARVAAAITVGATTSTDARASYSNIGTCLDIFAPGSAITSTWYTSNVATAVLNGTSMAAPHVTGAAAMVLIAHPAWTPQQVRDELVVADATNGKVTNAGTGSPNKLLFVDNAPPPEATVRIDGPSVVLSKATYTYTAVTTNVSGPAFLWSERFCDDYAGTSCTAWATITGLGSTFNRVLNKDCSTPEQNFQVKVVVTNYGISAHRTTSLCELP